MTSELKDRVELLPCPFCGNAPVVELGKISYCQLHGDKLQDWHVRCKRCYCANTSRPTKQLAIESWNKRPVKELQEREEKLVAALRFYANIPDYKAPYTGGMGKLYFDCG